MDKKKGFTKHEMSQLHKESMERIISVPSRTKDVGDMLSSMHTKSKRENAAILLKLLSSIRFLARQGQALRGNDENDNLTQLLLLRSEDDEYLRSWLKADREKYTSHEIQNELLQLMALRFLETLSKI